ncbi:MAG: hypothetical protein K0R54_3524 [Clostridiaceae bacterium]|jgi:hypothetical protein|nr:hypothetical protein [Clostridiaceae bacterium]
MKNDIVKIMRRGSTSNLYQLLRNATDKAKACNPSLFEKPSNKKDNNSHGDLP